MSTSTPPTPPNGGPSVEEMMAAMTPEQLATLNAIGNRVGEAVSKANSAAEAATAAAEAARAEGAARGVEIPEDVIKQISEGAAAATVAQLRQVGALREEGTPDPPAPGSADAGPTGPPTGPDAAPEGAGDPPPADARKSLAERFLKL